MKLVLAIAALAAATSVAFAEPYGLPGSGLEAHYMDGAIGPTSPSALPDASLTSTTPATTGAPSSEEPKSVAGPGLPRP